MTVGKIYGYDREKDPERYDDKKYQFKSSNDLKRFYKKQRKLSTQTFLEEMQTSKSYFSNEGFRKFKQNSSLVEIQKKGFYYVFQNKLYAIRKKLFIDQQNSIQSNIEQNKGEQNADGSTIFIPSSSADPFLPDDSLNLLYLKFLKSGQMMDEKFKQPKVKDCFKYIKSDEIDKQFLYNKEENIKKYNFVISVFQMPEMSHIQDVETGLHQLSSNSNLTVLIDNQFVINDKYCAIFISNKDGEDLTYAHNIQSHVFLIDNCNESYNDQTDKLVGILYLNGGLITLFMKEFHFRMTQAQSNKSLTMKRNKLKDLNQQEGNKELRKISLEKVLFCDGFIGLGIHIDDSNANDLNYYVKICGDGTIKQKKLSKYIAYSSINQRIRNFYVITTNLEKNVVKLDTIIIYNQTFQESSTDFVNDRFNLSEKRIYGILFLNSISRIKARLKNRYFTDENFQVTFYEESNDHKLVIIDYLNSNFQTYSFTNKIQLPVEGLINNKNYIMQFDQSDEEPNSLLIKNVYLGDYQASEITLIRNQNPLTIKINQFETVIPAQNINFTKFIEFSELNIPLNHKFRQQQICESFKKNRIFRKMKLLPQRQSFVQPWNPSMTQISIQKLGFKINDHFIWDWEIQEAKDKVFNYLVFSKIMIDSQNLNSQNTDKIMQQLPLKIFEDKSINFCTITPNMKFIFIIADDNKGYLQRLSLIKQSSILGTTPIVEAKVSQYQFDFVFENAFDVIEFNDTCLTLLTYSQNDDGSNFVLYLKKFDYIFDENLELGKVTLMKSICLSLYNNQWEQSSSSFQKCLQIDCSPLDEILRFGEYNITYKDYIILQQKNQVLIFDRHTLSFQGCFRFIDAIRKFKVIDNILYVDYDYFCGTTCIQGQEDLFSYLIRLNPQKLNIMITNDLQKITYLNIDDEVMGYIPLRDGYNVFQHKLFFSFEPSDVQISEYLLNLDEQQLSLELGRNMKNNEGTFAHYLAYRGRKSIQYFLKKLIQLNKSQIPLLFRKNLDDKTPFNIAADRNDSQQMFLLLEIMIKFQNNSSNNYIIDSHLNALLEANAKLEDYFNSSMPLFKIKNSSYPEYSSDTRTIYHSDFDQNHSLHFILSNYEEIFKTAKILQQDGGQSNQIDYLLVNIPQTLRSKKFIPNLVDLDNLEIFESECIQIILDYKWQTYTRRFYLIQFYVFILFLVAYAIDIYFFVIQKEERDIAQQLIVKLTCLVCLLASGFYEMVQLWKSSFTQYFQEVWNYFDLLMIIQYVVIFIVDIQNEKPEAIIILQGLMLLLIFVKLCQNLRIFEGFSFQVTMLQAVFYDIKYFILLYIFVILIYGLIFTLLNIQTSEENTDYQGISLFGYFIMAFRASTGDFQLDMYSSLNENHIIYAWLIWISAVLFLNIILLNFIIAVISESYEKVMQKMVAESYRIKCQLIKEREIIFNEEDWKDFKIFPNYIILRRPVADNDDAGSEWQGFVKDIKKTLMKVSQSITADNNTKHQFLVENLQQLKHEHETVKEQMNLQQKNMEKILETLSKNMGEKFEKILDLIPKIDNLLIIGQQQQDKKIEEEKVQNIDQKSLIQQKEADQENKNNQSQLNNDQPSQQKELQNLKQDEIAQEIQVKVKDQFTNKNQNNKIKRTKTVAFNKQSNLLFNDYN
eukprot:403346519